MGERFMPPVIKIDDQNNCIACKDFPKYAKFPFATFNPVQSRVVEIHDKDANLVIAAATSAGKTVCAEMLMAHEARVRGGKAMYLAPLKALAKEKIDDWTTAEGEKKHHFSDLKLSICTGDYQLTASRKKELAESNLILMTSEMLNSRCRNFKAEHNEWLKEVGTLVVDESHLLTVPGRGDHLEVGLMKFSQLAPNARIVLLSATMPNVDEIAKWVSYDLTGKDTYLLASQYRPCPLAIHYESYYDVGRYDEKEESKVNAALSILEDHPNDKFLVFVHTKRTGELMKSSLKKLGINCDFHNADLEKDKRHALEKSFRTDPDFRIVIATSTLAWGLNMPARRVIITGVHRGLDEVESYNIQQMAGRAGRVGLDPRGDVYVLLPRSEEKRHKVRLSKPENIVSKLLDYVGTEEEPHYKTLAFHLVSEIHHNNIKTKEDVYAWYEKSFAHFQAQDLDDQIVEKTLELLIKCGAIFKEDDVYKATMTGVISSMFYYSPFDVADLKRNFDILFKNGYQNNDIIVSVALGNVDTLRQGIVSRAERDDMATFAAKISEMFGANSPKEPSVKGAYAYFTLLRGMDPGAVSGLARNLQFDFPRANAVLKALDGMACKWGEQDWLKRLGLRMTYGVREELVDLCTIPNIGKVRAEKLFKAGIKSLDEVGASDVGYLKGLLKMKQETIEEMVAYAKMTSMVDQ